MLQFAGELEMVPECLMVLAASSRIRLSSFTRRRNKIGQFGRAINALQLVKVDKRGDSPPKAQALDEGASTNDVHCLTLHPVKAMEMGLGCSHPNERGILQQRTDETFIHL